MNAELGPFGTFLEQERLKRGWTPRQLAREAGVSTDTVTRWLQGINKPQPGNQELLAKALDISVEEIKKLLAPALPVSGSEAPDNHEATPPPVNPPLEPDPKSPQSQDDAAFGVMPLTQPDKENVRSRSSWGTWPIAACFVVVVVVVATVAWHLVGSMGQAVTNSGRGGTVDTTLRSIAPPSASQPALVATATNIPSPASSVPPAGNRGSPKVGSPSPSRADPAIQNSPRAGGSQQTPPPTGPATPSPSPSPTPIIASTAPSIQPTAPAPVGSLNVVVTENPFTCNGQTRVFARLSGAQPDEGIQFSSTPANAISNGTADASGNDTTMSWECDIGTSGPVTLSATGLTSGRTGRVTFQTVVAGTLTIAPIPGDVPFHCGSGAVAPFANLSGATPNEIIDYTTQPSDFDVLSGSADANGNKVLQWQCINLNSSVTLTAIGRTSHRVGSITFQMVTP